MNGRATRTAAVVAVAILVGSVASASGQEVTDPTVAVDRTGTAQGEQMLVTGTDWPKGATLIVELCGHGGLDGSVDCDVPHQRTAGVGSSGEFAVEITVGTPPRPCPCVVKATDQGTGIAATAPIAVAGLATVPIAEDGGPERGLEISSIAVTGGAKWGELFGAGGRRVLEVTLVNTGALPVQAPDVSIAWGTGDHPDGFVKPPETKALEPGETQTLTVGLDRPAFTLGKQTAVVEVGGFGEPIVATASTSSYPWGLAAVLLVLLQLVLLRIRNRIRRRFQRGTGDEIGRPDEIAALPPAAAMAALPAAPEIIDLREPEEEEIDEIVLEPQAEVVPEEAEVVDRAKDVEVIDIDALTARAPTNGHGGNGHGPAAAEPPQVIDRRAHQEATAVMSASLITEFANRSDALRHDVEEQRRKTSSALTQAAHLSEALVAAAEVRTSETRERAKRREEEANRLLDEATAMLERAREHAGELIDMAQRTAGQILANADLSRDAAERALSEVERERDELIAAARSSVEASTEGLYERLGALETELQEHTKTLLHAATVERQAPSTRVTDELDRRLARAVERALTEV